MAEEPEAKVVHTAGASYDDKVTARDEKLTPSARSEHWANATDGRVDDNSHADQSDQRGAFKDYESRPDIEQRDSILRREMAQPAEFGDPVEAALVTDKLSDNNLVDRN